MGNGLKEYLWTSETIVGEWGENCDLNAESFTKKFVGFLEKMGMEKDWYKSESANGNGGRFIFSNKHAPEKIKAVFDIYDNNCGIITYKEKKDYKEFNRYYSGM